MRGRAPHSQTRQSDRSWLLESSTFLDCSIEDVFQFSQDAHRLEVLTPAFRDVRAVTPDPIVTKSGVLIDYRSRLRGFPLRWLAKAAACNRSFKLVGQQLRGPYRQWQHMHEFEALDGGTICTDCVRYQA
jgi:ligand-binding SRPBCC domain-containing protein